MDRDIGVTSSGFNIFTDLAGTRYFITEIFRGLVLSQKMRPKYFLILFFINIFSGAERKRELGGEIISWVSYLSRI